MEEREYIVSLGSLDDEIDCSKRVEGCSEKTVGSVLEYMLDPNADELNSVYDGDQRHFIQKIKGWREDVNRDGRNKFELVYVRPDGSSSEKLDLNSKVSAYGDIVLYKTKEGEFGEEQDYQGIDLVANFINGGAE